MFFISKESRLLEILEKREITLRCSPEESTQKARDREWLGLPLVPVAARQVCSMMTHEEIRARIREKLKAGTLPRDLTIARRISGEVVREPRIIVGLIRAYPCAGCDELGPQITYLIGDVAIRFHVECQQIWNEERTKVQADP